MNSDDFFDQGPERPEIVAGRYRLPHPETGAEQSWTRATTHAELPEDSYALARWQLRQLLLGLRRRPDLLRLVESWSEDPGRDDLDDVIKTAHEVAGNDAKANLGTAVHGVLQQVDRAWNRELGCPDPAVIAALPEWSIPHVNGYLAELTRQHLTPIPSMVERRVVNLDLGCAGTLDNLYEEADGTVALGDKKTGRLDYPERKYAVQLAVYHGAAYLLDPDGGPPVDLRSVGLRREYAVLVYVDPESGACSVYRVDMRRAYVGANLAADVREWRRQRHFLLPYVPPGALPAEAWRAAERAEGERHLAVVPSGPLVGETRVRDGRVEQWAADGWQDRGEATPLAREIVAAAPLVNAYRDPAVEEVLGPDEVQRQRPDLSTFATSGGLADPGNEHSANSTTASLGEALGYTMDELMKLSKADLQGVLRGLDPGASVAHQRKILAEKILTVQRGGAVATSTPADTSRNVSKTNDTAELPAGPIGGGEDPSDPRSPAFHRARLAEVAAAGSAGELGRVHAMVIRVGGDQAWTDELTEAARARLAVLDAPARRVEWTDDRGAHSAAPSEAVALARSSQEMAQVWNLVTLGGSDEAAWTAELNEAAHARLAAIQAEVEQRPPSTPFGDA